MVTRELVRRFNSSASCPRTAEEFRAVFPVQRDPLRPQAGDGADEAAVVVLGERFCGDENDAAVILPHFGFFCEQRGDGREVEGQEGPSCGMRFVQDAVIGLVQQSPASPKMQALDFRPGNCGAQLPGTSAGIGCSSSTRRSIRAGPRRFANRAGSVSAR